MPAAGVRIQLSSPSRRASGPTAEREEPDERAATRSGSRRTAAPSRPSPPSRPSRPSRSRRTAHPPRRPTARRHPRPTARRQPGVRPAAWPYGQQPGVWPAARRTASQQYEPQPYGASPGTRATASRRTAGTRSRQSTPGLDDRPGRGVGDLRPSACFGLPSLIIGIVALTKAKTEPEETQRLTKIGWIVFGVLAALSGSRSSCDHRDRGERRDHGSRYDFSTTSAP